MHALLQHLDGLDVAMFRAVNGAAPCALLDAAMSIASQTWMVVVLIPLLIIQARGVVPAWRHALVIAALTFVAVGLDDWSASHLKQWVGRARPCQVLDGVRRLAPCSGSPSLPSSHAANMFALAAFTVACTRRRATLWFGVAAAVAYSRVRMGMHYPLDVIAGAVWGTALGWSAGSATRRLFARTTISGLNGFAFHSGLHGFRGILRNARIVW